jgi:hypothetical protein
VQLGREVELLRRLDGRRIARAQKERRRQQRGAGAPANGTEKRTSVHSKIVRPPA